MLNGMLMLDQPFYFIKDEDGKIVEGLIHYNEDYDEDEDDD